MPQLTHRHDEEPRQAPAAQESPAVTVAAFVRAHVRDVSICVAVLACIVVANIVYNGYLDNMFYREGVSNLSSTYKQAASTFELFASRNWNLLGGWQNTLDYISNEEDEDRLWAYFADRKDTWHFSDFYVFNQDDAFFTANGRSGTADSITNVFDEMYEANGPFCSSYIASDGVRKVVFAMPLDEPLVKDGVTYTGLAVSYDNSYVEQTVASNTNHNTSDCYVVKTNGDVAFSLQEKTVITEYVDNLPNFLADYASFARGTATELAQGVRTAGEGSALITYENRTCYVVYQPLGVFGWSLVSIVDAAEVDATLNDVRNVTLLTQFATTAVLIAGGLVILLGKYRREMARGEQNRERVEHDREMALQLFQGITEMADRYAVVDVPAGTYEYHEYALEEPLYPEKGRYDDLLEVLNQRYAALTEDDDAKLGRLLNTKALCQKLTSTQDRIKIEYAGRTAHVYLLMTVVPLAFDEQGQLTRVLLIGQDIGLRKELENAANTDELTGLFNNRYFINILHIKEQRNIPFTLFYLDLDRFKPINDTYGHDMGDKLLKQVAERMMGCIRTDDFAFRIGGDEFALIVTGGLGDIAARSMKERIEQKVGAPYVIDGVELSIGTSCGYASWPQDGDSVANIRILADARMYDDKTAHHTADGTTR